MNLCRCKLSSRGVRAEASSSEPGNSVWPLTGEFESQVPRGGVRDGEFSEGLGVGGLHMSRSAMSVW